MTMNPYPTKDLIKLVEKSPDLGNGWKEVSKQLWPVISKHADLNVFELKSDFDYQLYDFIHYIRIIPKSLSQQIEEWEMETKEEIDLYDRRISAQTRAKNIF